MAQKPDCKASLSLSVNAARMAGRNCPTTFTTWGGPLAASINLSPVRSSSVRGCACACMCVWSGAWFLPGIPTTALTSVQCRIRAILCSPPPCVLYTCRVLCNGDSPHVLQLFLRSGVTHPSQQSLLLPSRMLASESVASAQFTPTGAGFHSWECLQYLLRPWPSHSTASSRQIGHVLVTARTPCRLASLQQKTKADAPPGLSPSRSPPQTRKPSNHKAQGARHTGPSSPVYGPWSRMLPARWRAEKADARRRQGSWTRSPLNAGRVAPNPSLGFAKWAHRIQSCRQYGPWQAGCSILSWQYILPRTQPRALENAHPK